MALRDIWDDGVDEGGRVEVPPPARRIDAEVLRLVRAASGARGPDIVDKDGYYKFRP